MAMAGDGVASQPLVVPTTSRHPLSMSASTSFAQRNLILSVLAYLFFGLLHELSHVYAAIHIGATSWSAITNDVAGGSVGRWLLHITVERRCDLILDDTLLVDNSVTAPTVVTTRGIATIQHTGWIFSLLLAAAAYHIVRPTRKKVEQDYYHPVAWAALVTALEALSTDLLGLSQTGRLFPYRQIYASGPVVSFFCGNFGLILLNPAWSETKIGKKTALDMLQKMIEITMVRGAQSGGVVTFVNRSQRHRDQLIGVRSRVVNSKRSDLSKRIRAKVESDAFRTAISSSCGGPFESENLIKTFVGHTRFATSSIASFDGTHPHQWSPARLWRVYQLDGNQNERRARPKIVENYITHNGDFDFYQLNGKSYDLGAVQKWLEEVTSYEMPSQVDSAAIAGMIDILHCSGSFALSIRYAVALGLPSSSMSERVSGAPLPNYLDCTRLALFFETALDKMLDQTKNDLLYISYMPEEREFLEKLVISMLKVEIQKSSKSAMKPFAPFVADEEKGATLQYFVRVVVDAFFDNDLMWCTRTFLANAKGSFGLCVTSSLSAHRQLVIASRGQTNSVAFFPRSGVISYGSEQAAVKAGLCFPTPGGDISNDGKPLRLDLNDLNGEICLLDWGADGDMTPAISPPNRHLPVYQLMNGCVNLILYEESKAGADNPRALHHRMTLLEGHEFLKPLPQDRRDPIAHDLMEIPKVCRSIQDDWRGFSETTSLNRLTAWNFTKSLQKRLSDIHQGSIERSMSTIDILLTGCEVSLWLAEQFASDLSKAFPKLGVKAVSSNKLLGLFGQDMSVPSIGFPYSQRSHDLKGAIVIIVSHSGGTFAPLACSNLLQSMSTNLFVVCSEWDTQVSKQLRSMHEEGKDHLLNSRIFSTGVGLRPAEPASISVAATQQLLTCIFEHTCIVILSNPHWRDVSGAIITERDLQELERCNQENIAALEIIVGFDSDGNKLELEQNNTEKELREAGAVWAKHVLEQAKSYIVTFLYIFATVTTGFPVARAISEAFNVYHENYYYLIGFIDSAIFFWMPQMVIISLRLLEQRNLRHRMVTRTVVVGDCPWVSQCAEAFLGKIFACSYSIAGLNVLSGNPADHLVHRHTHRVCRGTLLICGRPDGRLSALTSLETSVCLSINQASSIQSIGGTCESVTIGHNPFKLPLSSKAINLDRHRPMYLCERLLGEMDLEAHTARRRIRSPGISTGKGLARSTEASSRLTAAEDTRTKPLLIVDRSASSLQGAYHNLNKEASRGEAADQDKRGSAVAIEPSHEEGNIEDIIEEAIEIKRREANLMQIFNDMDENSDGVLSVDEFVAKYYLVDSTLTEAQVRKIFFEADHDNTGYMDLEKFIRIAEKPELEMLRILQAINRPRSLLQVEASGDSYFGESLRRDAPQSMGLFSLERSQHFSMELYEGRIASMQRFVSMCVMFHEMGRRVENFFSRPTFGFLGYRYDRTHSIMRIATTASPVSGADVRERTHHLMLSTKVKRSIEIISFAWQQYKNKKLQEERFAQSTRR